jgi:hypothetical protein
VSFQVSSIILHTDKASDLLKRKKVKKEFLFKYLHDKRVESVEATSEKAVLIKQVMTLWGSMERSLGSCLALAAACEDSLPEAPAPSRNTSYSSLCGLDLHNGGAYLLH